jgi:hypothetical protein
VASLLRVSAGGDNAATMIVSRRPSAVKRYAAARFMRDDTSLRIDKADVLVECLRFDSEKRKKNL